MKEFNNKDLKFFVENYKENKYNPQRAFKKFKKFIGNDKQKNIYSYLLTIAASILVFMGVFVCYYQFNKKQDIITYIAGEQYKNIILPDGSKVVLAPHSCLNYSISDITKGKRTIQFMGKAYFSVHHDTEHPFVVEGQLGRVQVLGTIFQIDEQKRGISTVYVVAGKVFFSGLNSKEGVLMTKGMNSKLTNKNDRPIIVSSEGINQTAWATGIFRFNNTPINVVLKEISEYYHVTLTANDSTKRLSGDFEVSDLRGVIELLEQALNLKIHVNN